MGNQSVLHSVVHFFSAQSNLLQSRLLISSSHSFAPWRWALAGEGSWGDFVRTRAILQTEIIRTTRPCLFPLDRSRMRPVPAGINWPRMNLLFFFENFRSVTGCGEQNRAQCHRFPVAQGPEWNSTMSKKKKKEWNSTCRPPEPFSSSHYRILVFFAERRLHTRQNWASKEGLCRVPDGKAHVKTLPCASCSPR